MVVLCAVLFSLISVALCETEAITQSSQVAFAVLISKNGQKRLLYNRPCVGPCTLLPGAGFRKSCTISGTTAGTTYPCEFAGSALPNTLYDARGFSGGKVAICDTHCVAQANQPGANKCDATVVSTKAKVKNLPCKYNFDVQPWFQQSVEVQPRETAAFGYLSLKSIDGQHSIPLYNLPCITTCASNGYCSVGVGEGGGPLFPCKPFTGSKNDRINTLYTAHVMNGDLANSARTAQQCVDHCVYRGIREGEVTKGRGFIVYQCHTDPNKAYDLSACRYDSGVTAAAAARAAPATADQSQTLGAFNDPATIKDLLVQEVQILQQVAQNLAIIEEISQRN